LAAAPGLRQRAAAAGASLLAPIHRGGKAPQSWGGSKLTHSTRRGCCLNFEGKHVIVLERGGWEYVERKKGKEAVAVIATTEDGELILVEQYRRPVDARVIDWPAGLVGDDGENDPAATARQELEEETGYTCTSVELLAKS